MALKVEDVELLRSILNRLADQMRLLNDYLRDQGRLILMMPPRHLKFQASDVGQWRKVADTNQYRVGYIMVPADTSVGNAFIAPRQMPNTTDGAEMIGTTTQSYPIASVDPHQGEVWVNITAATVEIIFIEWVKSPLTARQI